MFGQYSIIQICKIEDLSVGDKILFSEKILPISEITENYFILSEVIRISKSFNAYYKVIDMGDRMKIDNWKKRLVQ